MDFEFDAVKQHVLGILQRCPECRVPYTVDDLRVVGKNGGLWVLVTRCGSCGAQTFVAAVVGDYDPPASDVRSLQPEEEPVVADPEPVTVDDVLEMHEFLETFDGDFHALFARRRR